MKHCIKNPKTFALCLFEALYTRAAIKLHALSRLLLVASVPVWSSVANAYAPLITDDSGTQTRGGHQIEFDFIYARDTAAVFETDGRVVDSERGYSSSFPFTYTYGLTDRLEAFVGVDRQVRPVGGWLNTAVGFKWQFAGDQDRGWSAAVKPSLLLPVSRQMQESGLGNAATNGQITLIGSYIGTAIELHLNAGYSSNQYATSADSDGQRKDLWSVSAAPVWVINDQWKLAFDIGVQTNPSLNSQYLGFGQVAVIYEPLSHVQLGLGFLASESLNSTVRSHGHSAIFNITYQF